MLLQGSGSSKQWEKIGAWRSWDGDNHGLDIQVIVVTRVLTTGTWCSAVLTTCDVPGHRVAGGQPRAAPGSPGEIPHHHRLPWSVNSF